MAAAEDSRVTSSWRRRLIFLFVFLILPIIAALYYSFTDYDLMSPPRLAGLKNYGNLLDDNRFPRSVTNTLFFAAGTVPTGTVVALLLATLINRHIRGIYCLPRVFLSAGGQLVRRGFAHLAMDVRAPVRVLQTICSKPSDCPG